MKERVTLTIASDVIRQVDKSVDGYKVKNRSHAVELLLLKALGKSVPKKAVILAGGKGTRLKPITYEIPKPMVPLHNKPLIAYSIDLLKRYGITDVIISIGFKGEKIKEYFGNGANFGMNISYVEEEEPLGTAGALRLAKHLLDDTFLVCNADEIKDININELFIFHKKRRALATIALTSVDDTSAYGVAKLEGYRILEFVEKPKKDAPSNLINSGLYIMEPEVLEIIPDGFAMLEKDVFPKLAKQRSLFGYPFSGYWKAIGTFKQYEEAIKDMEKGRFRL